MNYRDEESKAPTMIWSTSSFDSQSIWPRSVIKRKQPHLRQLQDLHRHTLINAASLLLLRLLKGHRKDSLLQESIMQAIKKASEVGRCSVKDRVQKNI